MYCSDLVSTSYYYYYYYYICVIKQCETAKGCMLELEEVSHCFKGYYQKAMCLKTHQTLQHMCS